MMKKRIPYYWLCQIGGWSAFILVYIFFYVTLRTGIQPSFYKMLVSEALVGFVITHVMRVVILESRLVDRPVNEQVMYIILISIVFTLIYGSTTAQVEEWMGIESEKQRQLSFLNKVIRISLGYFFIIIVWNLIYFAYHYVVRTRQAQLDKIRLESLVKELELKTIKSHINPHFIFNALNGIKRMILEQDISNASRYLSKFAQMIRLTLSQSKQSFVTLKENIEYLESYLEMEKLRFDDSFTYTIQTDDELTDEGITIPTLMIQPLVENAIWHGLMHREGEKAVDIVFSLQGEVFTCAITDNGIGIRQAEKLKQQRKTAHRSVGLDNLRNRISIMNEKYHMDCALTITDRSDNGHHNTGTQAVLRFKLTDL